MFDTPTEARLLLQEHFPRPQVAMIVEALVPALGFEPVASGETVLGGTRIGGTPDLPPGPDWPKRARPADAEAIAARGSREANAAMAEHFRRELPYAFLAQIDLGEAAALGAVAQALPGAGRLLAFYDLVTGPYDTGSETVRVIWDTSPRASLKPQALPVALGEAAREHRRVSAEAFAAHGMTPPGPTGSGSSTPYDAPSRPMRLKRVLRLPDGFSGDMDGHPALKALWQGDGTGDNPEDDAFRQAYQEVRGHFFDRHYGADNPGRRHQLVGSADPEQDDPRFDAVVVTRFGVQHLDGETWNARFPEIEAEARHWRLLLQVDLSDHAQDDLVAGTVYVLIRDADLRARLFERAVAVYQQT